MQTAEIQTKTAPNYKKLREGDIISIKVQADASIMQAPKEIGGFYYLHFGRPVPGTKVNFHVRGAETELLGLRGTTIRARVEIFEKTYPDGRRQVLVDLYPVGKHQPITARLVFDKDYDGIDSLWAIQLPQALSTFLHILPADGKLPPM